MDCIFTGSNPIEIKKLQDQVKQQQMINLSLMSSAFAKAPSALPNKPNSAVSNMQSTVMSAPSTAGTVADSTVASAVSASDAVASGTPAESANPATDAKGTN